MKNLIVIRHAKSSWAEPGLADRERPLNKRGKRDAPFMGALLRARGVTPDLMVASPARRATKTARLIAAEVGYPVETITVEERVYRDDAAGLIDLIGTLPNDRAVVFLIGHNPTLTDLVNLLAGESVGNLPTCSVADIEFAGDSWAHIAPGTGRLRFLDYPKRHLAADDSATPD